MSKTVDISNSQGVIIANVLDQAYINRACVFSLSGKLLENVVKIEAINSEIHFVTLSIAVDYRGIQEDHVDYEQTEVIILDNINKDGTVHSKSSIIVVNNVAYMKRRLNILDGIAHLKAKFYGFIETYENFIKRQVIT